MRIVSNGAICAVNAKEMRRLEKWRKHNMLKAANRQLAKQHRKDVQNDGQRDDRTNHHGG